MRIDGTFGIDGIENRGLSNTERPAAQGKPVVPGEAVGNQEQKVAATNVDLVNKALACKDIDPAAVQRGLNLLQSGALDTPQAAQAAADAILDGAI